MEKKLFHKKFEEIKMNYWIKTKNIQKLNKKQMINLILNKILDV